MKEKIWDLFKLTGDVKYYMMYKEIERSEKNNANDQSEGNNNK